MTKKRKRADEILKQSEQKRQKVVSTIVDSIIDKIDSELSFHLKTWYTSVYTDADIVEYLRKTCINHDTSLSMARTLMIHEIAPQLSDSGFNVQVFWLKKNNDDVLNMTVQFIWKIKIYIWISKFLLIIKMALKISPKPVYTVIKLTQWLRKNWEHGKLDYLLCSGYWNNRSLLW